MTTLSESYVIDDSDHDFVGIIFSAIKETVGGNLDASGSVWFERSNLAWLVDALTTTLDDPQPGRLAVVRGADNLRVREGGHEAEPYIHIINERPDDAPRGGAYWIGPSKALAQRLTAELAALLSRTQA